MVRVDIHCVTKWSKLGTSWTGVSLDTLLDGVETAADHALAFSDGGYTTNVPLEDLTRVKAWIAYEYDGKPLDPVHGGPTGCWSHTCTSGKARSGCAASSWARTRYPASGRRTATTSTEIHGKSSGCGRLNWQTGTVAELVTETVHGCPLRIVDGPSRGWSCCPLPRPRRPGAATRAYPRVPTRATTGAPGIASDDRVCSVPPTVLRRAPARRAAGPRARCDRQRRRG